MKTQHKLALARAASGALRTVRRLAGLGDLVEVRRRGLNWSLDLTEGIDLAIYLFGRFEPRTAEAYRRLIRPGHVVLDIGANVGAHTLPLAECVGERGRVIAIEPTDYAFAKLRRNIALNAHLAPRITAEQIFLAARDGGSAPAVYSRWPVGDQPGSHRHHGGALESAAGAKTQKLDSFLAERNVRKIDFIKMDVDGFEVDILSGATETLRAGRPTMALEVAPYVLRERGASLEQFLALLQNAGYRLVTESRGAPLPMDAASWSALVADGSSVNVIATAV